MEGPIHCRRVLSKRKQGRGLGVPIPVILLSAKYHSGREGEIREGPGREGGQKVSRKIGKSRAF